MATYLLREIPERLRQAARARAQAEGRTLRWVLVQALRDWVTNAWTPGSGSGRSRRTKMPSHRSRELEWRRTHREVLQTFAGQWVVFDGEEIITHGNDSAQVAAEARAKGIQAPYLFHVEVPGKDVVRMGL